MPIKEELEEAAEHFIEHRDIESAITIVKAMLLGYIIIGDNSQNLIKDAISIILTDYEQLEAEKQEVEKTNDKYLQKLVYALTPTKHALGTKTNEGFKKIIAENIDLETYEIRRKLKEYWGIDKY